MRIPDNFGKTVVQQPDAAHETAENGASVTLPRQIFGIRKRYYFYLLPAWFLLGYIVLCVVIASVWVFQHEKMVGVIVMLVMAVATAGIIKAMIKAHRLVVQETLQRLPVHDTVRHIFFSIVLSVIFPLIFLYGVVAMYELFSAGG